MQAVQPQTHATAPVQASVTTETLETVSTTDLERRPTGLAEVDRVVGGGWVAGSAVLIAGEPGIGKSTLLLQLAHHAGQDGRSVLYVAGEESLAQIKIRAERMGVGSNLQATRTVDAAALAAHIERDAPDLVIVDSIQTLTVGEGGVPGSLTQVRDGTAVLTQAAKRAGTTLVLIGHVTKQGTIAGPKVVEHVVDATFALESAAGYRIMRALKNRFGPAGEVGVFDMTHQGMAPVANPSLAFLAERPSGVPGSVVAAMLEGQRPMLLEVQALASSSPHSNPKRVVQGLDARRVDVVLAVLERRAELPLGGLDVFVNVAGGLRVTDPGADLAVAMAVWSAVTNQTVREDTAFVGEIGLAGEVRGVHLMHKRVEEATRSGFSTVFGPSHDNAAVCGVKHVADAMKALQGRT